jgi:hypothetical protein
MPIIVGPELGGFAVARLRANKRRQDGRFVACPESGFDQTNSQNLEISNPTLTEDVEIPG